MSARKALRDFPVDIIRGIAIFTMVAANMAASLLVEPHPLAVRFYGTFAAPIFIFLSGMMVALTSAKKSYGLGYYIQRGSLVVLVAALVDLAWGLVPFLSVDVLYLIGISLPLSYLYLKLGRGRWLLPAGIIGTASILQYFFTYEAQVFELGLGAPFPSLSEFMVDVIRNWTFEGWFPVFPWLAVSFLGAEFYHFREKYEIQLRGKSAIVVFFIGVVVWVVAPGPLYTRSGYSEMFYPPTPGFLLTAFGVIGILFYTLDRAVGSDPGRAWGAGFLRVLGEASLFFYISHIGAILLLGTFGVGLQPLSIFIGLYAGVSLVMIGAGYGLRGLRIHWTGRPHLVRFFLG